jgi:Secretion system C-terminal sorting domain
VYGYSICANDLPTTATPANLVNFNNATFFPTNTTTAGGIDLVSVTGIYVEANVLAANELTITAQKQNDWVNINFKSLNEINVLQYQLERSTDGTSYTNTGNLLFANTAQNGNYKLNDNIANVKSELVYYRVKQTMQDGKIIYSNIAVVKNLKKNFASIFPNPTNSIATLNYFSNAYSPLSILIIDAAGKTICQTTKNVLIGTNNIILKEVEKLPAGFYHVKIQNNQGLNLQTIPLQKL